MMANNDRMLRAMAEGQVLALAATSTNMTETARVSHGTSPVATAALGRTLTGTVMMGQMLKNDTDKISVQITGDGPLGGILVTADTKGHAKGYVNNPTVIVPNTADGHLGVGNAIGNGTLSVIKDMGIKDTYNGHIPLYSGEIAEDLTQYFLNSEQTPSSVGLGVLMDRDTIGVKRAGGFIIQLLPGAKDETIDRLEANIHEFGQVTDRLMEEEDPGYMLDLLLKDFDREITAQLPVSFKCDCSRDRVRRALALLGEIELASILKENRPAELKCQFCNTAYGFDVEELREIYTIVKNKDDSLSWE